MVLPTDLEVSPSDPRPARWVLRLLNGLQQGAEAPLADGIDSVIGRDDACDLVLWDDSVAPRHGLLRADGDGLRVQALEAALLWSEGRIEVGQSVVIRAATTIQLGEVIAGLGPPGTDWQALPRPRSDGITGSQAQQPSNPTQAQAVAQAPASQGLSGDTWRSGLLIDASPPEDLDRPSAAEPKPAAKRPASRLLTVATIALALLIAGASLVFWTPFRSATDARHASEATEAQRNLDQARALLAELGMSGVGLDVQPNGVLSLRGYCPTRAQRDLLTSRLLALGWRVDNRVWPEDQLREVLTETLDRLGLSAIDYAYLGQGVVRLRGWLRVGLTADQVARTLQEDVPGVQQVMAELNPIGPVIEDLRAQVRTARLERKLVIDDQGAPPIRIAGQLDAQEMARWNAIRDTLSRRYPQPLPLEADLTPVAFGSPEGESRPRGTADPVLVQGILVGPEGKGYALLGEGERVGVGDLIRGRYLVEALAFDHVLARDEAGGQVVFRVGVNQP